MHYLEPFILDLPDEPDFSPADLDSEIQAGFNRQRVVQQFLKGKADLDDLLDSVADAGVDAYEYSDLVDAKLKQLVGQQVPLEGIEKFLAAT